MIFPIKIMQAEPWGESIAIDSREEISLALSCDQENINDKIIFWGVFGLKFKDIYNNEYTQRFEFALTGYQRIKTIATSSS